MKAFTEPLLSLAGFEEMTKTAEKSSGLISVTGCIDAQKSQMIYAFGGHRKNKLIVTFGEQKAKELYDEYSFFDKEVVYYPSKDVLFYQSDIRGQSPYSRAYQGFEGYPRAGESDTCDHL